MNNAEAGISVNTKDIAENTLDMREIEGTVEQMSMAVGQIQADLTCSGSADLDVCGCGFGYTYYLGECCNISSSK